jgi:demethylmenaquinone methyltransferase / 2-methoxy-6-polyprenyl-1,4-benzoquinol methylase
MHDGDHEAERAPGHGDTGKARDRTTSFGFEEVSEGEKTRRVHGVFSSVASRYDLMNDLMSGGIHRLWKSAMIDWLAPRPGMRVLDVAGGTGDIAFRILDRTGGRAAVTVLDLTEAMLAEGRRRAEARPDRDRLDWIAGDAQALPFPSRAFDAYTIAFGIRNVANIPRALAEARRVLRPGGRLLVLEFSRVSPAMLRSAYDAYSFNAIPALGQLVAGDRASYQYLVESIRRFPDAETFAGMVAAAGFGLVRTRTLSFGIVALTSGWRL